MNHTQKTLAALLASQDKIIYRNAMSILKRLQNCPHEQLNNVGRTEDGAKMRQCTTCGILRTSGMR